MKNIMLLTGKLNNREEPLRLGKIVGEELVLSKIVQAKNLDIDVNGFTKIRNGRTLRLAGDQHSFWVDPRNDQVAHFVEQSTLKKLNTDFTATAIASLSVDSPACFVPINDATVMANGVDIGWIEGLSFFPFAPTLRKFEKKMPSGQYLCLHNGCLHVAVGDILYVSKPQMPEVYDERYGLFPMGGYIRMIGSVNTGLWIGTEKGVGFITGDTVDDYELDFQTQNPCPDGAFLVTTEENEGETENLVAWVSEEGFCQGRESGSYQNHSHPDVALPKGEVGLLYERFNNGIRQYIAVIHKPESERKHTGVDLSVNTVII